MKKFILGFILGSLLFSTLTVFAATELKIMPNPFPVFVDGKETEVEGYNINGYTFLKLRDFEKVGLGVDFKDNQIIITTKQEVIESESAKKEGDAVSEIINTKYKGYDAVIKDGVTFVDNIIFRIEPNYMMKFDENNMSLTITRNGITRILTKNDYFSFEGKLYIPLNIVNELGL